MYTPELTNFSISPSQDGHVDSIPSANSRRRGALCLMRLATKKHRGVDF
jgi:hypothetical protein